MGVIGTKFPYVAGLTFTKQILDITTTTSDDRLYTLLNAVSGIVRSETGRDITLETHEERIGGYALQFDTDTIVLEDYPISRGTAMITVNEEAVTEKDDYEIDYDRGVVSFNLSLQAGDTVTIFYKAGFDPVPTDLQLAAARMVATLFYSPKLPDLRSERLSDRSYTRFGSKWSVDIEQVLSTYRKVT